MPAATFTELLPPTKSAPRSGYRWTPSEDRMGCGLLVIEAPRVSVTYLVVEHAATAAGRAWHFAKATTGTDPEAEGYDVFVSRSGKAFSCQCKGFFFGNGKACKHVSAAVSLMENGQI